jgi:ribulose-5-phosphate 4-epimerase/fuculose-1-phosphate aldolase
MVKDLILLGKEISKFVVGFEGNISKKNKNKIIIKSSGSKLDSLTIEDFVTFDFNLTQLDNFSKKGSMELGFHKYFLSHDDINFVVHTHPVNCLKILCTKLSKKFSNKRLFPDQVIFNGEKSLLIPYVTPGIELEEKIIELVEEWKIKFNKLPDIILLQNHGIITFGKTLNECIVKTEICEKSAEIFLWSMKSGQPTFLEEKEILKLINDEKEKYRLSKL